MFSRLPRVVLFFLLSFLAVAIAMPGGYGDGGYGGNGGNPVTTTVTVTTTAPGSSSTSTSCSTGPVQCCNSLEKASSPAASLLLGLLGIVVEGVDVLLGLTCSPISVIGVGSSSCSSNVVCCQNNAVGGLISIGCVPIIL